MLNNRLNEIMSTYPHDYSLHDIDFFSWCKYTINNNDYIRLILGEVKRLHESFTGTQLTGLQILSNAIDWQRFDSQSNCYLLQEGAEDFEIINIYNIHNTDKLIMSIDKDTFYKWISCKDITNNTLAHIKKDYMINNTDMDYNIIKYLLKRTNIDKFNLPKCPACGGEMKKIRIHDVNYIYCDNCKYRYKTDIELWPSNCKSGTLIHKVRKYKVINV